MNDGDIYRTWRQADPRYNEVDAWPEDIFPKAEFRRFKQSGCLITSLAIMLRHYNLEKETSEDLFNPLILNSKLIENNVFDEYADIDLANLKNIYPLEYIGGIPYSYEAMIDAYTSGEPFLITVPGVNAENHFVVPDHPIDGDMAIIDCAWGKERLSEFEIVKQLRLFKLTE